MEINDVIRAWLQVEPKETQELLYDYNGQCINNMTMNL